MRHAGTPHRVARLRPAPSRMSLNPHLSCAVRGARKPDPCQDGEPTAICKACKQLSSRQGCPADKFEGAFGVADTRHRGIGLSPPTRISIHQTRIVADHVLVGRRLSAGFYLAVPVALARLLRFARFRIARIIPTATGGENTVIFVLESVIRVFGSASAQFSVSKRRTGLRRKRPGSSASTRSPSSGSGSPSSSLARSSPARLAQTSPRAPKPLTA